MTINFQTSIFFHFVLASALKLLIPNYSAGALIGKGGSKLIDLQNTLECKIKLSNNGEYYPGTDERVVAITAVKEHLIECNNLIMETIAATEDTSKDPMRILQVKMVLTDEATGLLIGRGGCTIQAIQENSKAKIIIVRRSEAAIPGERLLTVFGSVEERFIACRQIIEKIASEYGDISNTNVNYNVIENTTTLSIPKNVTMTGPRILNRKNIEPLRLRNVDLSIGTRGIHNLGSVPTSRFRTTVKLELEIPSVLLGSIMGTMSEIARFSGARMLLSDEFVISANERILTVSGSMSETNTAYFLISQKFEQARSELFRSN